MKKSKKAVHLVRITPENSQKVLQVIDKTHRTFATEVNVAVEEQMDERIRKLRGHKPPE